MAQFKETVIHEQKVDHHSKRIDGWQKPTERRGLMNLKYKKITIALIIALSLGLFIAGPGVFANLSAKAQGPAVHSQEDVIKFGFEGQYPPEEHGESIGLSNLVRKSDGIHMQINTSELKPDGVYTYWWSVDDPEVDNPEVHPFDLIVWAGYDIVKPGGQATTNIKLGTGAAGIADNPNIFVDEGDSGLSNPYGASVAVQIVYHGQLDDFLAASEEEQFGWLHKPWVGDDEVCTILLGIPEDPVCPLAQLTFHAP